MGLVGISLSVIFYKNEDEEWDGVYDAQNILIGIILMVTAMFSYSMQMVLEEKYMKNYDFDPINFVGR